MKTKAHFQRTLAAFRTLEKVGHKIKRERSLAVMNEVVSWARLSRLLACIGSLFDTGFMSLMECARLTAPTSGAAPANASTCLLLAPGAQCK
jgi:hypothetical protein